MKNNYKRIGELIELVDVRNRELSVDTLLGITINKNFIPSVANTVGTNMANYKIIRKNQFACSLMQVRRDKKIPVALLKDYEEAIISQAYPVFEVIDTNELLPEYLMMWFSRSEFDREACFYAVGGVRGSLEWEDFLDMQLPVLSIEKQKEIVKEYNTIVDRIALNEKLNQKLEETAQALYKHWFVDNKNIDSDKTTLNEIVDINPRHTIKKGESRTYVELADLQEKHMSIKHFVKRDYMSGAKFKNNDTLIARITPSFENGKIGFVDILESEEVAFGSTEFIVLRAKEKTNPYFVYCLAKDEDFRKYAIGSMIGSSGRQRVQHNYLKEYRIHVFNLETMNKYQVLGKSIFNLIKKQSQENKLLKQHIGLLLSKMTKG